MICLTREELIEWSGYRQRTKIGSWLRCNGVAFLVGADGWPRVRRDILIASPKTLTKSVPNISALQELQNEDNRQRIQQRR